ncbi:MAG: hypothetical protein PHR53_08725 [Bacteroidales bacterium]|nr:hypothetical protein [Bacteroidales bacterium]
MKSGLGTFAFKDNFNEILTVQNHKYSDMLYFHLTDPIHVITDFYYTKGVGRIKYTLKSGIIFERQEK